MLRLFKYGAKTIQRFAAIKWNYRCFNADPHKEVRENVLAVIMDTLKRIDKCNVSKLTPKATFEELGINFHA